MVMVVTLGTAAERRGNCLCGYDDDNEVISYGAGARNRGSIRRHCPVVLLGFEWSDAGTLVSVPRYGRPKLSWSIPEIGAVSLRFAFRVIFSEKRLLAVGCRV